MLYIFPNFLSMYRHALFITELHQIILERERIKGYDIWLDVKNQEFIYYVKTRLNCKKEL